VAGQTPTDPARHVLFLNWRDTRNAEGGGSEVYVERVASELVAAGHRVTVFCAAHADAPSDETTSDGVRFVRRGGRHSVYIRAALTYLAGWLGFGRLSRGRLGRPNILVDVCNGMPFLSPLYARVPVIALVHHVHREQWPVVLPGPVGRFGWWVESRLAPRVYRRCRYITVSDATRSELATLGVDPARVRVVHNGTPHPPSHLPVPVRSPNPALLVLCRLVPHKQVELALNVVAALVPEMPDLRLVVAGHGWWEPRLRDLVATLGIADRVEFAGFVTEERKHELLGSAWAVLVPSLKEGWGLSIVEAGLHGTPAVAFRHAGGVTEAVVDGVTGLLARDQDDFTAQVRRLVGAAGAAGWATMSEAARAHATGFTWTATGEQFGEILAEACGVLPPVVAPRTPAPAETLAAETPA
jgi:glycosyltransferase involved in cell wall biosynthesis